MISSIGWLQTLELFSTQVPNEPLWTIPPKRDRGSTRLNFKFESYSIFSLQESQAIIVRSGFSFQSKWPLTSKDLRRQKRTLRAYSRVSAALPLRDLGERRAIVGDPG